MERLIIDGMNVIGSRPNGWWRDRPSAVRMLVDDLAALAERRPGEFRVVFDGGLPQGLGGGVLGLEVIAAPGRGRGAADDRIVALVESDPEPAALTVISSDRALRERVCALGARVAGARTLLSLLEGEDGGG